MAKNPSNQPVGPTPAPAANPQVDIGRAEFDELVAKYHTIHDHAARKKFFEANPILSRLFSAGNHP